MAGWRGCWSWLPALALLGLSVLALRALWQAEAVAAAETASQAPGLELQGRGIRMAGGPGRLGFSARHARLGPEGFAAFQIGDGEAGWELEGVEVSLGPGVHLRAPRGRWSERRLQLSGGVEISSETARGQAESVEILGTSLRFPGQLRLRSAAQERRFVGQDFSLGELLELLR